jgi:hypothetical protein
MNKLITIALVLFVFSVSAQDWKGKFEQLDQTLPTPNEYRSGSGSPGPKYWQQKADYEISVELNDLNQSISGTEKITYHNNSPDILKYLWVQLDQNLMKKKATRVKRAITLLPIPWPPKQWLGS